jgi:hypothetical protein
LKENKENKEIFAGASYWREQLDVVVALGEWKIDVVDVLVGILCFEVLWLQATKRLLIEVKYLFV